MEEQNSLEIIKDKLEKKKAAKIKMKENTNQN